MTSRFPISRTIVAIGLVAALGVGACSSSDDDAGGTDAEATTTTEATIPDPRLELPAPTEVEGPITGGDYGVPYLAMPEGWEDEFGYTEQEYFLTGEANAFAVDGGLSPDGAWDATRTDETADYTTRMIVRRPSDPEDFNGTLVVEWLNVSAGRDSDPDFGFLAEELLTQGYAYAAVSAQQIGVEPGGLGIDVPGVIPEALAPLKEWDPTRYGDLSHPGDAYSYDIYSQATRALLDPSDEAPLGGLVPEHLLAAGESQSAFRLTTYANAVQPVTELFDGFFIHSRGVASADLNDTPEGKAPEVVAIRDDVGVPVFQFATETDLELLQFVLARQPDSDVLRTWEAAGTAHADQSTLDYAIEAGARWTDSGVDLAASCGSINDGPQQQLVQTLLRHLQAWVVDGTSPPESPRIETDEADAIVRDPDGIAIGGIRTPAVDAPVAILTGTNPTPSVICSLFGSTEPLSPAELADRYGDTNGLVTEVEASADAAVADGFLLERHAEAMIDEASETEI
jgi:hypothetical protein